MNTPHSRCFYYYSFYYYDMMPWTFNSETFFTPFKPTFKAISIRVVFALLSLPWAICHCWAFHTVYKIGNISTETFFFGFRNPYLYLRINFTSTYKPLCTWKFFFFNFLQFVIIIYDYIVVYPTKCDTYFQPFTFISIINIYKLNTLHFEEKYCCFFFFVFCVFYCLGFSFYLERL